LIRKRGSVEFDNEELSKGHLDELIAHVPLAELRGFSTHLRTLTSGNAFFGMELSHYKILTEDEKCDAIEDVTGFRPS
jgi:translation elongation factor EF-G